MCVCVCIYVCVCLYMYLSIYSDVHGQGLHPEKHAMPGERRYADAGTLCWILEILCCAPKGRRALLRIPTTGRAKCLSMLGAFKT